MLVGSQPPDGALEVSVASSGPAFALIRAFETRLRGRSFIGFVRRFSGDPGEPEVHWHLAADTSLVVSAVEAAVPH
jgi:hypothetical protein